MAEEADLAAVAVVDFAAVAAPAHFAEAEVALFVVAGAWAAPSAAAVMAEASEEDMAADMATAGDVDIGADTDSVSAGAGPDTGGRMPMIPTITDTRMDTRPTMDTQAITGTIRTLAGLTPTGPPPLTRLRLLTVAR